MKLRPVDFCDLKDVWRHPQESPVASTSPSLRGDDLDDWEPSQTTTQKVWTIIPGCLCSFLPRERRRRADSEAVWRSRGGQGQSQGGACAPSRVTTFVTRLRCVHGGGSGSLFSPQFSLRSRHGRPADEPRSQSSRAALTLAPFLFFQWLSWAQVFHYELKKKALLVVRMQILRSH